MLSFSLLVFMTVSISTNLFQGVLADNTTDTVNAEEQSALNATDQQAADEGVREEATEVVETEVEGETEAMATEEVAEVNATEEATEAPATPQPRNMTTTSRAQAFRDWSGHVLASRYMGSLVILYLALCIFLALKQGPLFVQ